MAEFIEFLSADALAKLKEANAEIVKMVEGIKAVGQGMGNMKTPSEVDNGIKNTNSKYDELRKKIEMIASLNKQRYLEEAKLVSDNDKALSFKAQNELKQMRAKQAMIASLNAQREKENADLLKQQAITKKMAEPYNKLKAAHVAASNSLRNLVASGTASNAQLRQAQKEFDVLDKKIRKADQAVGNFSRNVGNYKSALSGVSQLMGAFGISTGLYLGASIAKDIFQTTKELQSLDLALEMVSGSQEAFGSNQSFLASLAEQYGIEIKGLTKNFTEFWVASKDKLAADQIKEIFTSISKSVAVMGLSIDQQNSAFLALQQMMSKGTVQAEELKKQLGNALPGAIKAATMAYKALHPELDVTEKFFIKQMSLGKVISAELLPELAKAYEQLYGIENVNRVKTLAAEQSRLANSWVELVRAMDASNSETIGGRFLRGAIINAKILLETLTDVLSTQAQINERKQEKGAREAQTILSGGTIKQELKEFGGSTIESQRAYLKEQANHYYKEWEAVTEESNRLAEEFNSKSGVGQYFAFELVKNMESANRRMGEFKTLFQEYTKAEKELGKTKTSTKTEKQESEAERKKREAAAKKLADFLEDLRINEYKRKLSDLERELEIIKDNYDNKKNLGNDYIKFAFQMADKEVEIIDLRYEEEMRLAKKNGKNKKDVLNLEAIATNNHNTERENAYKKHLETLDKIRYDNRNGVNDTGQIADEETFGSGVFVLPPEKMKGAVSEWEKQQEAIKKTREEVLKLKDALRDYFEQTQSGFFSEVGFNKTFEMFLKVDDKGNTMFENLMAAAKETGEEYKVQFLAISETAQEIFNKITEFSNANFDNEYENLEKQKNVALLFASESETGRAEIEKQYEERRKAIRVREFQAKKKLALFNIAIDTAQAIMAAAPKIPLMIAMGVAGAIQAGIVASQQVPQFWKGTDNAPEGFAWTQEKGREIITDKHGNVKSMGSDGGAQMTYLNKGDKVLTNTKTMMFNRELNSILASNQISPSKQVAQSGMSDAQVNRIVDTIANKESINMNIDKGGLNTYVRNGHTTKEILNKRVNFIGKSV